MNANYKIERTENGTYLVKISKGKKCTFTLYNKLLKQVTTRTFVYFENVTDSINAEKEHCKSICFKVIDVTKENIAVKTRVLCDDIETEWETV